MLHWLHANQLSSQSKQRRTGSALGRKGLNVTKVKAWLMCANNREPNMGLVLTKGYRPET